MTILPNEPAGDKTRSLGALRLVEWTDNLLRVDLGEGEVARGVKDLHIPLGKRAGGSISASASHWMA